MTAGARLAIATDGFRGGAGGGSITYVVATEAITSELAAIVGVAPLSVIQAGAELSTLSSSGSIKSLSSIKELGTLNGSDNN
jgi:hypothetical protein